MQAWVVSFFSATNNSLSLAVVMIQWVVFIGHTQQLALSSDARKQGINWTRNFYVSALDAVSSSSNDAISRNHTRLRIYSKIAETALEQKYTVEFTFIFANVTLIFHAHFIIWRLIRMLHRPAAWFTWITNSRRVGKIFSYEFGEITVIFDVSSTFHASGRFDPIYSGPQCFHIQGIFLKFEEIRDIQGISKEMRILRKFEEVNWMSHE